MALSHTGFFLLRSPLYPIKQYREILRGDLPLLANNHPLFIYALYIASKDLLKELERYISDPASFNAKKADKLQKSLYKYWVRACTRSTPYGLFAGCTTGTVATESSLELLPVSEARQHVRLDMDYYTKICHHIQELPTVSTNLRYYTNNSIYKAGEKYRYAEYIINNNRRRYLLTAVADSVFLEKIFREAINGITIAGAMQLIVALDPGITADEATEFVQELIRSQLLVAETEPRITGNDNLNTLIGRLSSIEHIAALRDTLLTLQQLFQQQDFERSRLNEIHTICETAFPLSAPKDLLQIDLFKHARQCSLSEHLVQDITQQVGKLLSLCHGYTKDSPSEMSHFITRFQEQYESQEMPLNAVLDGETGIGYGAGAESSLHVPFVEDIATGGSAESTTVHWTPQQQLCLAKYETFLREGNAVVYITDEELQKAGDPETVPLAHSCYLFGTLQAASAAEADKGNYTFAMQSLGGPSAANLLGRFCSGDPVLTAKVKEILAEEEAAYPDAVLAEVVHFPEARAANVLIRPSLRNYEIPYIGIAGVPDAFQIPVSDLMVSVRNKEVVLRSKRLNKRVIPRLSSAHNYSFNSLPIYKFLCDLQQQSVTNLHWDWGVLGSRQRLPRVMYKNIILSRGSWTLTAKELEQAGEDEASHLRFFEAYRQQQGIPDKVLLADADNELLLELTQPVAIAILMEQLKRTSNVLLKECLTDEDNGVVRDTENKVYAHEILLPLVAAPVTTDSTRAAAVAARVAATAAASIPRCFVPGSEWLYVKIYCGYRVAEELLSGYFAEQLPEWQEDGLFEQFFFLRYGDPQQHIRLRFHNSVHPANNDVLLHRIEAAMLPYIRAGQVQKIQCDTYVREMERYGAATMLQSEALFYSDSMAVLGIISMLEGADGETYRWKLAMRGVNSMLDDFGLTLPQKKHLLTSLREAFIKEFGGSTLLHKPLNDKYRKHQQEIMSLMNPDQDHANDIAEAIAYYQLRSEAAMPVAAQIREDCGSEDYYLGIIASHIHMFLNRIFVGQQRKHELVLYHFLEKYYLSQLAMAAIIK